MNHRSVVGAIFLLSLFSPCRAQKLPGDDKVFGAMRDELSRTMSRLRMKGMPSPYFASYAVAQGTFATVTGSFGSLVMSRVAPELYAGVQIRVGDSAFDNTHFLAAGSERESFVGNASFEADYDNLRAALWSLSDEAYKDALQDLARKKAYKERRLIKENFGDLSREETIESYGAEELLPFDRALWEGRVREISAVFKEYADIQDSQVTLSFQTGTKRLLTSEGTAVRSGITRISLEMGARAQALNGLRLADSSDLHYVSWKDVPRLEVLKGEARRLAIRVKDAVHGGDLLTYVGPVLFEDEAAAEFFDVQLVDNISNPRGCWSENEENRACDQASFVARLGLRVAVPFLDIADDPLLERFQGVALFGHYRIDSEGVPARRVNLVEKGKLVGLYMSRAPIKERRHSNGHGRAEFGMLPTGRIGNLIVTPQARFTMPKAALKEKLRGMCRELGLDYGIVVRRMQNLSPVSAYKVSVADGREEPLKGLEFTGTGTRPLRDIVAVSAERSAFNFYHYSQGHGLVPASIVAPSILVVEMEIKKTEKKPDLLPYLKHPFFAPRSFGP